MKIGEMEYLALRFQEVPMEYLAWAKDQIQKGIDWENTENSHYGQAWWNSMQLTGSGRKLEEDGEYPSRVYYDKDGYISEWPKSFFTFQLEALRAEVFRESCIMERMKTGTEQAWERGNRDGGADEESREAKEEPDLQLEYRVGYRHGRHSNRVIYDEGGYAIEWIGFFSER